MDDVANEDAVTARAGPPLDSYGHAAYLLIESLLHELVAGATITNASAIRTVDLAADTGAALAAEGEVRLEREAVEILRALAASLRTDQAPVLR